MPIPVSFIFKLTQFTSFTFFSVVINRYFTCFRYIWVVFWVMYYKFSDYPCFFAFNRVMMFMVINNISWILLSSFLVNICWYLNSFYFYFHTRHELKALDDFDNLTSLSLFLFSLLKFDSSLMILYIVHFWGIFLLILQLAFVNGLDSIDDVIYLRDSLWGLVFYVILAILQRLKVSLWKRCIYSLRMHLSYRCVQDLLTIFTGTWGSEVSLMYWL